jgi:hypothetical protein
LRIKAGYGIRIEYDLLSRTIKIDPWSLVNSKTKGGKALSCARHVRSSGVQVLSLSTSSTRSDNPCPALAKGFGSNGSLSGRVSGRSIKAPQYWLSSCVFGTSTLMVS